MYTHIDTYMDSSRVYWDDLKGSKPLHKLLLKRVEIGTFQKNKYYNWVYLSLETPLSELTKYIYSVKNNV